MSSKESSEVPKNEIISEEKPQEDSTISEQKTNSNSNPNQSQEESKQEEQAELSEVETGGKDQPNFEEIITFYHTFLNYRITRVFKDHESLVNSSFNLLLTNVFMYSGNLVDFK